MIHFYFLNHHVTEMHALSEQLAENRDKIEFKFKGYITEMITLNLIMRAQGLIYHATTFTFINNLENKNIKLKKKKKIGRSVRFS